MKKKILALLAAGLLLSSGTGVHANMYSARQERIADALYHVELFRGTNLGYELGRELTRAEGITLLVRMLGQEEAAMKGTYSIPFTDVAEWAKPYVGYAYANGITNGISATEFGSQNTMTDYMFITLTLRALGYSDRGKVPQFVWNDPYMLAKNAGLISAAKADSFFSRGDAVEVFWNALSVDSYTLAYSLSDRGVFTTDELEEAMEIYQYGKIREDGNKNDNSSSIVTIDKSNSDDDFDWSDWDDSIHTRPSDNKPSGSDNTSSENKPSGSDNKPSENKPSGSENKPSDSTSSGSDNKPSDTKPSGSNDQNDSDDTSGFKPETPDTPTTPEEPTKPNTPTTPEKPETPSVPEGEVTYEMYIAMSGEEQQAYYSTFSSPAEFFAWLNAGKAEYEASNPSIEIGGNGSIDLGDLIG